MSLKEDEGEELQATYLVPTLVAVEFAAVLAFHSRFVKLAVRAQRSPHEVQESLWLTPTDLTRDLVVVERTHLFLVVHFLPRALVLVHRNFVQLAATETPVPRLVRGRVVGGS